MAKNKNLSDLTLDELYEEKKKRKGMLTIIGTTMVILCGILVFLAVKNENNALIAVASGCFITLFPGIAHLGQVDKEIKSREQK